MGGWDGKRRYPPWPPERIERASQLWLDGLSASAIAAELGDGLTRNSVIGMAHRQGWPRHALASTGMPRTWKLKPKQKQARRRKPPGKRLRGKAVMVAKPEPAPVVADVPEAPGPMPLLGLSAEACRWPVSGEGAGMLFCGEPAAEQPYCVAHRARAFAGLGRPGR